MSTRIILFGIGDILLNTSWTNSQIIAIGDIDQQYVGSTININSQSFTVCDLDFLKNLSFDFIIITDSRRFNNLYIACAKACIPQFHIISLDTYIHHVVGHTEYTPDTEQIVLKAISCLSVNSILDYDMFFADGVSQSRNRTGYAELADYQLPIPDELSLIGISPAPWPLWNNIYSKIYPSSSDVKLQHFELFLLMKNRPAAELLDIIESTYYQWDNLLIQLDSHSINQKLLVNAITDSFPLAPQLITAHNKSLLLLKKSAKTVQIYVVCHKPYNLPKLSPLYYPIHAGKNTTNSFGLPGDNTGDSISFLNPYINELTAMYWIWKNTQQDIVGLMHYHRYLVDAPAKTELVAEGNILELSVIQQALKEHDMIAKRGLLFGNFEDCYRRFHGYKFYEEVKKIFLEVLKEKAPDYADAFLYAMSSHNSSYNCNMFITRRHVFDAYCRWLFPVVFEALRLIDIQQLSKLPNPQKRIVGFMGEALFACWRLKQNIRIIDYPAIELPYDR